MRIACWITKIKITTQNKYVKLNVFPLQQRLQERSSLLRYIYISCLVWMFHPNYIFACVITFSITYAGTFSRIQFGDCNNSSNRVTVKYKFETFSVLQFFVAEFEVTTLMYVWPNLV